MPESITISEKPDPRKGAARPTRQPLTRERIIDTALCIMDDEGLEAVTMRRIGRELGVEAMSLYNHVEGKEDILDGVTELVMGEFDVPPATGDWVVDASAMAMEWRRVLRMHPNVIRLFAERHKPLESLDSYRPMEAALDVIGRLGLAKRDVAQAFNAFGGYIMGFVMMEQGMMLGQAPDDAERAVARERMARALRDAGYVHMLEALPHLEGCSNDEQFEFGLDLLIRGLQARATTPT
jgi:TetR/AcrR family tetracycline transcriptional repressor